MKRLFIVTNDYPYGDGDSTFVLPELPYLKKSFHITIISTSNENKVCAKLLDDVEYKHFKLHLTGIKKIKYFLCFFSKRACWQELFDILEKSKKDRAGRFYKSVEFFACAEEFYRFLKKEMINSLSEKEGIFLNYWCNAYSLSLVLHKKKYTNLRLVTRLHGYDLYDERYAYGRQPFKKMINEGMDEMFFVSYNAREYYLKRHPELEREKTHVSSLGVERRTFVENRAQKENSFLMVSCSSTISLKRVELIIQALALLRTDVSVRWFHFGDGNQQADMKLLAEKMLGKRNDIFYSFMGNVANEEIKQFYCKQRPDCFITVSSTEGSPVSVMEALACGIPVIGTAVGDIPYMIDGNGILLSINPKPEEIADAIKKLINCALEERQAMRGRSVQLWEERYDREKNEQAFVGELKKMLNDGR